MTIGEGFAEAMRNSTAAVFNEYWGEGGSLAQAGRVSTALYS